jgi:hypothetical protein
MKEKGAVEFESPTCREPSGLLPTSQRSPRRRLLQAFSCCRAQSSLVMFYKCVSCMLTY